MSVKDERSLEEWWLPRLCPVALGPRTVTSQHASVPSSVTGGEKAKDCPLLLPPTLAGPRLKGPLFGGCCAWNRQFAAGHLCCGDDGVSVSALALPEACVSLAALPAWWELTRFSVYFGKSTQWDTP